MPGKRKMFQMRPETHQRLKEQAVKEKVPMIEYIEMLSTTEQIITKVSPSQYRINVPQPLDREESMMTLELFKRVIVGTNPGVSGFIVRFLNKGELV